MMEEQTRRPEEELPAGAGALRRAWGRRRLSRLLRMGLGILCILLGVVGLFVPVLQGVLTLVVGLALLAPDVRWVRRILVAALRRWPGLRRRLPRRVRRLIRHQRRA